MIPDLKISDEGEYTCELQNGDIIQTYQVFIRGTCMYCWAKQNRQKNHFICSFVVVNGAFSYILTGQYRPDSEFDMIPGTNAIAK